MIYMKKDSKIMRIPIFLLMFLTIFPMVSATNTTSFCSDNSTLYKQTVTLVSVGSNVKLITTGENVSCAWGCKNAECMLPPWGIYLVVFVILLFGIIIWALFFR